MLKVKGRKIDFVMAPEDRNPYGVLLVEGLDRELVPEEGIEVLNTSSWLRTL